MLVVDLQRIPGLSDLPVGDTGLPGQRLQERFDLRLAEVPPSLARARVPVEELADPVRIEWTAALLDAQFLQDLKVPLRPAWIRGECSDPTPRPLLTIAHVLHTLLLAIVNILQACLYACRPTYCGYNIQHRVGIARVVFLFFCCFVSHSSAFYGDMCWLISCSLDAACNL